MGEAKLRLLILSAASFAAQSVIDAIGARREHCVLVGANSVAEAAGSFRCDTVYLVPPAASGAEYFDSIVELIRIEQPDIVIPGRDDDVLALAALGERQPAHPAVLLSGPPAIARIWNDKVESARFAAARGLPFAPTAGNVRAALDLSATHGLPLIGKPRSGNGGRGVVILRSEEEIDRAFQSSPDLIAQPFLDPPANMQALIAPFEAGLPFFFSFPETSEYTVQIVVGPDGEISNAFGCLNTLVRGQAIEYRRCNDPELLVIGAGYARAAAAEGWKGPLNVQLKRSAEGKLEAHEVNGRFTGGTGPRAQLGFDELAEVVSRFLPGRAFPSLSLPEARIVQISPSSYPIPHEGLAALQSVGRWSAGGD